MPRAKSNTLTELTQYKIINIKMTCDMWFFVDPKSFVLIVTLPPSYDESITYLKQLHKGFSIIFSNKAFKRQARCKPGFAPA
jgi:hypothetical protein